MKYTENYVYMYGQMISTCSFLLDGDFPKADGTAEIKGKYHLVGVRPEQRRLFFAV